MTIEATAKKWALPFCKDSKQNLDPNRYSFDYTIGLCFTSCSLLNFFKASAKMKNKHKQKENEKGYQK
jgi:hypothetical protein